MKIQRPIAKKIAMTAMTLVMTLIQGKAIACDEQGLTGFMPENDMKISVFQTFNVSSIDESAFNTVIDRVLKVYEPIVKEKGGKLFVNRNWKSETVNASANRSGVAWMVNMYGGLARHPAMTEDGFMLVVCHELGHQIGGAPRTSRFVFMKSWAANEGQADYWGSMKCMRRILNEDDNVAIMANRNIDPKVAESCGNTFKDDKERALCSRIAMAGKALSDLLGSGGRPTSFSTPDSAVVGKTFNSHPQAQCRLDTYFQGSLCTKDYLEDVSLNDTRTGVCVKSDGFTEGVRPLCWYKPKNNE